MEPFRSRTRILTGILVFAELFLTVGTKWAAEVEQAFDAGFIAKSMLNLIPCIVGFVVLNILAVYGIIFKCVYFQVRFDSDEELKKEGEWSTHMAAIATAVSFVAVWGIILIL